VWLVSALYPATAVGRPVIGRLVDSFGPRRPSADAIAEVTSLLAPGDSRR
jgi:hypothetical protein